jgi:Transcription factor/nuclear export subunit protein 2
MHNYNAILILKELLPVFPPKGVLPRVGPVGPSLVEQVEQALARETALPPKKQRSDLKLLTNSYLAQLKLVRSRWEESAPVMASSTTQSVSKSTL